MRAEGWRRRQGWLALLSGALAVACSGSDPVNFEEGALMPGPWGPTEPLSCDLSGTWVIFVQVGVEWSSPTIKEGAGKVIQWILSEQQPTATGAVATTRSCGIGATGVPLGSAWFSTRAFPNLGLPNEEWTGVTFSPSLFDSQLLPIVAVNITMEGGNPGVLKGGERMATGLVPYQHGVEGVPDNEWPAWPDLKRLYMRDHDQDGQLGLTGTPFVGQVPGTNSSFQNPRLEIDTTGSGKEPARTSGLHMAIRNRAQLDLRLVSCNPPRFEGIVVPGTLLVETRNVACTIAGTGQPCNDTMIGFIDGNLPKFVHNDTSQVVAVKAPPGLTCDRARTLSERR